MRYFVCLLAISVAAFGTGCASGTAPTSGETVGKMDLFSENEIDPVLLSDAGEEMIYPLLLPGTIGGITSAPGVRVLSDLRPGANSNIAGRRVSGFRYRVAWSAENSVDLSVDFELPEGVAMLIRATIVEGDAQLQGIASLDQYHFVDDTTIQISGSGIRNVVGLDAIAVPENLLDTAPNLIEMDDPPRKIRRMVEKGMYPMTAPLSEEASVWSGWRVPASTGELEYSLVPGQESSDVALYRLIQSDAEPTLERLDLDAGEDEHQLVPGAVFLFVSEAYRALPEDPFSAGRVFAKPEVEAFSEEATYEVGPSSPLMTHMVSGRLASEPGAVQWFELSGALLDSQLTAPDSVAISLIHYQRGASGIPLDIPGAPPARLYRALSGTVEGWGRIENEPAGPSVETLTLVRVASAQLSGGSSYEVEFNPGGLVERRHVR